MVVLQVKPFPAFRHVRHKEGVRVPVRLIFVYELRVVAELAHYNTKGKQKFIRRYLSFAYERYFVVDEAQSLTTM